MDSNNNRPDEKELRLRAAEVQAERAKMVMDSLAGFCHALGQINVPLQSIDYILISHYHPDHMGIAQQIMEKGPALQSTLRTF